MRPPLRWSQSMQTLISLVLTAFLFVISAPMASAHQHAHGEQAQQHYDCPMHPEVIGEKGDTCPKCGMNLTPVKGTAEHKKYPHGKHHSNAQGHHGHHGHHDAGKCDNCPKHQGEAKASAKYDCPMHPEVVGEKGDTCPKCGMHLTPVKEAALSAKYDCPMHSEVVGEKGDTCPKCGMNLTPVNTAHGAATHKHH